MRFTLAAVVAISLLAGALPANASTRSGAPYLDIWKARLSETQLTAAGRDLRLAGRFKLVLRKNGTYTSSNSLDGASHGKFKVSGRRIVFFDDVGCRAGGFDGNGVYTWSLKKGKLRLSARSDPCGGRQQTLEYPVWSRA